MAEDCEPLSALEARDGGGGGGGGVERQELPLSNYRPWETPLQAPRTGRLAHAGRICPILDQIDRGPTLYFYLAPNEMNSGIVTVLQDQKTCQPIGKRNLWTTTTDHQCSVDYDSRPDMSQLKIMKA